MKARAVIELAANVLTIAALAVAAGVGVSTLVRHPANSSRPGLHRGERLQVSGLHLKSGKNLIIALGSKCGFCAASVPFYRQLATSAPSNLTILAAFREDSPTAESFLRSRNLDLQALGGIDFSALKIAGTPAILLVDGNGKLLDFWLGYLTPDVEQEVKRAIGAQKAG